MTCDEQNVSPHPSTASSTTCSQVASARNSRLSGKAFHNAHRAGDTHIAISSRSEAMYTLLLPGRSYILEDAAATTIRDALNAREATATIGIELNGEGSGDWDVTINLAQVIALIAHPVPESVQHPGLRLVRD